jgi:hypothetical protein
VSYVTTVLGLPRSVALNAVVVAALTECVSAVLVADRLGSDVFFGLGFQLVFAFPFSGC